MKRKPAGVTVTPGWSLVALRFTVPLGSAVKTRLYSALAPSSIVTDPVLSVMPAASSLTMRSMTSSGAVIPAALTAVAETRKVLSGVSKASSTAVTSTSPVLRVWPAGMLKVRFALRRKFPLFAGGTASTKTTMPVSADEADASVAVTRLTPPSSSIEGGVSSSVRRGSSTSVTSMVTTSVSKAAPSLTRTVTLRALSRSKSSMPATLICPPSIEKSSASAPSSVQLRSSASASEAVKAAPTSVPSAEFSATPRVA